MATNCNLDFGTLFCVIENKIGPVWILYGTFIVHRRSTTKTHVMARRGTQVIVLTVSKQMYFLTLRKPSLNFQGPTE